jgi:hypothetical protein
MKLLKHEQWVIVIVVFAAVLSGITWGLPDAKRMNLLLAGTSLSRDRIDRLNRLRDEFSSVRARAESLAVESYFEGRGISHERKPGTERKLIFTEKDRLAALRLFILSSSAVDEMHVPQCLARMNPSKLDFDPKSYVYGGAFLYPVGAAVFMLKVAGLLHVTNDFSYYVNHPSEVALLYIPGRIFNLVALVLTIVLLGLMGNSLAGRFSGTLAMLAYACSSLVLNYSVVEKPHIYAAFWSFLALFCLYRHLEDKRMRSLVISIAAAGMAVGSSLPAGVIAIMYPIMFLTRSDCGRGIKKSLLAFTGMAVMFLFTNPYAVLSYKEFLFNIVYRGRGDEAHYLQINLDGLAYYLKETVSRAYAFPVSAFGLLGAVVMAVAGNGFVRRLAVMTLLLLLLIGASLGQTRISLFMGPVLCLFSGIALSTGTARLARPLRLGIMFILFIPGIGFSLLFARDTVFPNQWYKPTVEWIKTASIGAGTTIGVMSLPAPTDVPPFPFLDATLIDMNEDEDDSLEPKYVLVGNFSERTLRAWDRHPLRSRYSLIYNLGYRPSYDWLLAFRDRSQSRVAGLVYEHVDSMVSRAPAGGSPAAFGRR